MKASIIIAIITISLNAISLVGFGIFSHFQLEYKVVELQGALKVSIVEMKLHIVKEIIQLKKELKIEMKKDNIAFRK